MGEKEIPLSKQAYNARRQAQRRIKAYKRELETPNLSADVREMYETAIRDLRQQQANTRMRTKSGHIIPGRNTDSVRKALTELQTLNKRGTVYIGTNRQSFITTQNELNKASVGDLSAQYTKAEVKIFYKATQKAWQRDDVGEHERNKAILEYYGRTNLASFVDEVLKQNRAAVKASEILPTLGMSDEQREEYEEEQRHDNEDGEKGSPTYMADVKTFEATANYIVEPERQ